MRKPKQVKICLELVLPPGGKKGSESLRISVDPWAVVVAESDQVEWHIDAGCSAHSIQWFRIEASGPLSMWPFHDEPPADRYKGSPGGPATSGVRKPTIDFLKSTDPVTGHPRFRLIGQESAAVLEAWLNRKGRTPGHWRFPYSIAIGFLDENGVERRVDIDPDMIVET